MKRAIFAAATTAAVSSTLVLAPVAQAADVEVAQGSAIDILDDGAGLDSNGSDHDLFVAVTKHVLKVKKRTRLKALIAPEGDATVFAPTDAAVIEFANDVLDANATTEQEAFDAILNKWNKWEIEWAVRYHVSPGEKLNRFDLLMRQGDEFKTLLRRSKFTTKSCFGPDHIEFIDGDDAVKNAHLVGEVSTNSHHYVYSIDQVMRPRAWK